MMRRLVIVLLVLVALVIVAAVAVQVVMMTDLPRQVLVAQLQDALGLEVEIDDLQPRWSGHAEARGIRASLPLEDDPFLEAAEVRLKHTALLNILLTRSVDVESVFVEEPVVHAVQRADGSWNLQQVQEVLASNLAGDPDAPSKPGGLLPLPRIELRDARVVLDRHDQPTVTLRDVRVSGERRPPLTYALEVIVPRVGRVDGRISRAAPHAHEVSFNLAPEPTLVEAFVGKPAEPRLAGRWQGRVTSDAVRGRLELSEASMAGARLSGSAQLTIPTDEPALVVATDALALEVDHAAMPEPVHLIGGHVRVTDTDVQLQDVQLAGFDGRALVRGQFDPGRLTGELTAIWDGLALPEAFTHDGRLDVELARRGPSDRVVEATLETHGRSELGDWAGVLELNASGEAYNELEGTVTSETMRYELRGHRYRLAHLQADFVTDERSLRLTQFAMGDVEGEGEAVVGGAAQLSGAGVFDWVDGTWAGELTGEALPLPDPGPVVSRLRLLAEGDAERVEVEQLEVEALSATLEAEGAYVYAEPEPLRARLRLRPMPLHVGEAESPLVQASHMGGELEARGTLDPMNLRASGHLLTEGLTVRDDELGEVTVEVEAFADGSAAGIELDAVEWLGGEWRLGALYGMEEGAARLFVDATDVDLTLTERLVNAGLDVEMGRADLSLEAAGLERGLSEMQVEGEFTVRDLARAPLLAERVTGRLTVREGEASVRDLELVQGDGRVHGEARVELDRPSQPAFSMRFDDWPVQAIPDGRLNVWVNGQVSGMVDAAERSGDAEADLSLDLISAGLPVGQVELDATLAGTMLRLDALEGRTLEGTLQGEGRVDLADRWGTAELSVIWSELQPRALEAWLPVMQRMSGTLSGSLSIEPTRGERALGPLRMELVSLASDARVQDLPIGDGQATAYLDRDRLVLQNLLLEAMGGQVGAWGRVSDHDGERLVYASGWMKDLDLQMISEALRPDEEPLLGRMSADLSLSSPLDDWQNTFGRGTITLRDSDIGTIPLISVLYDVMNVALVGRVADGRGSGTFRVEQNTVQIERFLYENRSLSIRLSGVMHDLQAGMDSPFNGVAALSLAPLPDVELLEVANEAIVALQADATTVRLSGRINDPDRPVVIPFRGVFDAVRRVLGIQDE